VSLAALWTTPPPVRKVERKVSPAILVGIVDISADGQQLLSALLFSLGCRIMTVDCQSDSGGAIAARIRGGAPQVVVWQLGPAHESSCEPLLSLLAAGTFGETSLVVVSPAPAETRAILANHDVLVLPAPYTPVTLMHAVAAAQAATRRDRITT
jgi:hypothetical protein